MSKTLIIAEKPSVAADVARALGGFTRHADYFESSDYVLSSAVGHLLEIGMPEEEEVKRGKWTFGHLPAIPSRFALKPIEKNENRLKTLLRLIKRKDVGDLINACDAGREGELIFRYIVQFAKASKPIRRLWLQSMTTAAIREGFDRLRTDAQMRPLADAAVCRSEADWLVGINGTRAMTAFNSKSGGFQLTTVGRVQTPTLAIMVEREQKIRAFRPRGYWEVLGTFRARAGEYAARWFDEKWTKSDDDPDARAERLWDEAKANAIVAKCAGKPGEVTEEAKPTTQGAPLLYDLTSLQREANGRFGLSARTTLSLAQSLYEKHKVLTYPRTDSRALPEDYLGTVKATMEALAESSAYAGFAAEVLKKKWVKPNKRIFDNAKVSDHFAIIPTLVAPKHLNELEAKLYDFVVKRFLAAFYPAAEFLVTTRITRVAGEPFKSEGKVLMVPGWLAVYGKEAPVDDRRRPGEAGRKGDARGGRARRARGHREDRRRREHDAAARAPHRGDAALGDGRRRQADRRRGAARGDAREGARHAGDARADHRGPHRREIRASRGSRARSHRQGVLADDAAARTGGAGALFAGTHRGMGVQARADGAREAQARRVHARDRRDDAAHRGPGQGLRKRHDPRRLRHAERALPELRRRGARELQEIPVSVLRVRILEDHGRAADRRHRGRHVVARTSARPARWFPQPARQAVQRVDPIERRQRGRVRLRRRRQRRCRAKRPTSPVRNRSGPCPKCGARVFETTQAYVCEKAVGPEKSCDFRSGRLILQRPVERAQMQKLLATGKTDLLQFVSARTKRGFSAFLVRQGDGKIGFEFEARDATKAGARRGRGAASALRVLGPHPRDKKPVELHAGRYGPYVKHGDVNATLPDRDKVDALTLAEAVALLDEKAAKQGTAAPPKAKRKATPKTAAEPRAANAAARTRKPAVARPVATPKVKRTAAVLAKTAPKPRRKPAAKPRRPPAK